MGGIAYPFMKKNYVCAIAHILASHPAARHLKVVLPVVLWLEQVLSTGLEKGPHRLLILKHQVNVTCQGKQECYGAKAINKYAALVFVRQLMNRTD